MSDLCQYEAVSRCRDNKLRKLLIFLFPIPSLRLIPTRYIKEHFFVRLECHRRLFYGNDCNDATGNHRSCFPDDQRIDV